MRLDRTRHSAEAQQTQQTHDAGRNRHAGHGYAGGMHKGVAYRHAPRPQSPARRNTGPAAKPRPRPASTGAAAAHQEEEHPLPTEDALSLAGAGTGGGRQTAAAGGATERQSRPGSDRQGPRSIGSPPQAPPPPPNMAVQEGAALRRSRLPAAQMLSAPPTAVGLPLASLLEAHASLYFKGGSEGAASALRLATRAAVARHLPPDAQPPALADIKAAAIAWCAANGPPAAATQAQRHANLLYPLDALRAMFRPAAPVAEGAQARSAVLQRALERRPTQEPTS
ncbi:hypothetical protein SAMN05216359_101164 [Roseateles sp. YR242]|uniref:hypothetical protein n=1 Tax=Roseateles sp. YR242 TaxID=1855305 RepID=UPI0008C58EF9|nr:hypothetical protein [Roseateles sp. YR242]SEK24708.1 hypothetical protein SAMN05216359_101164 [Roseateles sp. YR242]